MIRNSTNPGISPLFADRFCGDGAKLIYYMNPGELISRPIMPKDTHSVSGDLLVVYSNLDNAVEAIRARANATTAVLGFKSPSFSLGVDIILPVEINQQLRDVLLTGEIDSDDDDNGGGDNSPPGDRLVVHGLSGVEHLYVPEVSYELSRGYAA